MKTYKEYLLETDEDVLFQRALQESVELTEDQDVAIDLVVEKLLTANANGQDLEAAMQEVINEGLFGSIFGGLTGFALGKTIGKLIAKVLGIEKGVIYDLLTSRLVGAALGSALGKKL